MTPKYLIKEVGANQKRRQDLHPAKHSHKLLPGWLSTQTLGFWSALRLSGSIFRLRKARRQFRNCRLGASPPGIGTPIGLPACWYVPEAPTHHIRINYFMNTSSKRPYLLWPQLPGTAIFSRFHYLCDMINFISLPQNLLLGACALLLSLVSFQVKAQTGDQRIHDHNNNGWYMYFGDHKLSSKWGLHSELQLRRYNTLKDPQQLLIRTGVNYNLTPDAMFTLGYGLIETYPYGDFPAPEAFLEHRLYEQLQLKGSLGRFGLTHRYRLEQRWIEAPQTAKYTYLNRARYFLKATLPLVGPSIETKKPYLAASNEVFVGFGDNIKQNIFDQNRAYIALGYKFSPAASAEIGYMNQIVQKANGVVFEHNHTLQVGLTYNLDFSK